MTLPASGHMSLMVDVLAELQIAHPARSLPISLTGDADVRALAGKPTGQISFPADLYGKSAYVAMTVTGHGAFNFVSSGGATSISCAPYVTVTDGSGGYSYLWSFTSNPDGCTLSNATSAACTVSKSFIHNSFGSANATLQCSVTDSTAHNVIATGITTSLDWEP